MQRTEPELLIHNLIFRRFCFAFRASDAIASPLYVPDRAKKKDEAACKQKGNCKSIACHL
jgi:hypothetical protein